MEIVTQKNLNTTEMKNLLGITFDWAVVTSLNLSSTHYTKKGSKYLKTATNWVKAQGSPAF